MSVFDSQEALIENDRVRGLPDVWLSKAEINALPIRITRGTARPGSEWKQSTSLDGQLVWIRGRVDETGYIEWRRIVEVQDGGQIRITDQRSNSETWRPGGMRTGLAPHTETVQCSENRWDVYHVGGGIPTKHRATPFASFVRDVDGTWLLFFNRDGGFPMYIFAELIATFARVQVASGPRDEKYDIKEDGKD